MAGSKETPRQKLINLMYLVFITMLALNVSKEVLFGFGQMYVKLKASNEGIAKANTNYYSKIKSNAIDKEGKWIELNQSAELLKDQSEKFYGSIQQIKNEITEKQREKDPDLKEYNQMDRGENLDLIFFGNSQRGAEFVKMIDAYKKTVTQIIPTAPFANLIEDRFNIGDENFEMTNSEGLKQSWLSQNFEGFPLISSLAKLTMMQNDIRVTEQEILTMLMRGELEMETEVTESNYITLLKSEKPAYYPGETFDGSLILGRKGGTQNPNRVDVRLDGSPLQDGQYDLIPGGIRLKVRAGNPGDHELEGELIFMNDGEESKIPVKQKFVVISEPNAAVISADKMNVVYRGVDNPMTISIPGIANNKVTAKAPGLRQVSGSKYVMNPGTGREVTILARGILPDGKRIETPTKFRIKDIPRPTGTVRGESGNITIPKGNLEIATIGAELDDFDFDIQLETVSFKFKAPGQPSVQVRGSKLDSRAKSALRRVRAGQTIQIFDIKVRNPNNPNYRFKKVSPVICDIVN